MRAAVRALTLTLTLTPTMHMRTHAPVRPLLTFAMTPTPTLPSCLRAAGVHYSPQPWPQAKSRTVALSRIRTVALSRSPPAR